MKSKAICFGLVGITRLLFSCSGEVNDVPEPYPAPARALTNGRRLITNDGHGYCHAIFGVPGASAMVAPLLECFYQRSCMNEIDSALARV